MAGILNIVVWSHEIGEIHTKINTRKRPVSWQYSNQRYKQHSRWDMLKQQYAKCSVFRHGYWHILIVPRNKYSLFLLIFSYFSFLLSTGVLKNKL